MDDRGRQEAVAAVGAVRGAMQDAGLAAIWTELDSRWDLDSGAYFTHPLALPVVALPRWAAPPKSPVVVPAQASAVAGYLHARILDDAVDADQGSLPPTWLVAASWLQTLHLQWLGEAATDQAPSIHREATTRWGAFARAMAFELGQRGGSARADAETHLRGLDRSRPLVLPALAVCRTHRLPEAPLLAVVENIIDAHQRYTDLLDLQRDQTHGHTTWAYHALGLAEGPTTPFEKGHLDRWLADIDALHTTARHAAPALPGLGAWLDHRTDQVAETRRQLWTGYLRAWLQPGSRTK